MRLIDVEKFSENLGVRKARGYELARQLPPGVRVELGGQIRINEDALDRWIEKGGTLSNGGRSGNMITTSARPLPKKVALVSPRAVVKGNGLYA